MKVNSNTPSQYEIEAIKQIHSWKNPKLTWLDSQLKYVNEAIDKAGEVIVETPIIGDAIQKTTEGLLSLCNDISQATLPEKAILKEFKSITGEEVNSQKDFIKYDLEIIDKAIGLLSVKYKSLTAGEGAITGVAGLPGIPADVVALISLNLRAIGEYCVYCGFNPRSQHEKLFMMNLLALSSSHSDKSKVIAMSQLVKIAKEVAKKKTWKELEKHAFVKIIQQIAKAVGIRLTKAKLAQIIPAVGAIVGGGFNYYFTSKVTDAAFYLYRERFLAEKYGEDIIETTVNPASDYNVNYEDIDD